MTTSPHKQWIWPLDETPNDLPDYPGQFGAIRKFDIHTGVDLYTSPGMPVLAVEPGIVTVIEDYTGAKAGSPWWHDTQAVFVEGESGCICYGEIDVDENIEIGTKVEQGAVLGKVKTVLTKDKGRPMTMLHFEIYEPGTLESVIWHLDEDKPSNLLDPTDKLHEVHKRTLDSLSTPA